MINIKKIVSIILTLAMCASLFVMPANASYAELSYGDASVTDYLHLSGTTDTSWAFKVPQPSGEKVHTSGDAAKTGGFMLLEAIEVNGKTQYAILQNIGGAIKKAVRNDTTTYKFSESTDTDNLIKYLNDVYAKEYADTNKLKEATENGGYTVQAYYRKLQNCFVPYLQEHTWDIAASNGGTSAHTSVQSAYTVTSKVAIPSWSELKVKYADRVGSDIFDENDATLRTNVYDETNGNRVLYLKTNAEFANKAITNKDNGYIFPMFYVSEDFFKNVKLADGYGAKVGEIIAAENGNDYDALEALGYTPTQIAAMGVSKDNTGGSTTPSDEYVELSYGDASVSEPLKLLGTSDTSWGFKVPQAEGEAVHTSGEASRTGGFMLLEEVEVNGKTQYAILQNSGGAIKKAVRNDTTTYKFSESTDKDNLIKYLNDVYAKEYVDTNKLKEATENGGYTVQAYFRKLQNCFVPYLQEHTWDIAASNGGTSAHTSVQSAYTVTSKVAIPSWSELKVKYADRVGSDIFGANNATLRTNVYDATNGNRVLYLKGNAEFANTAITNSSDGYIFPMFYVSEDFFKNVKLADGYGANVAKVIAKENDNSYSELHTLGYTDAQIEAMGVEITVSINGLEEKAVIAGSMNVGQRLEARLDAGTIATAYQWCRAESADATEVTPIKGATSKNYILTSDDIGKYIVVKATINAETAYIGKGKSVVAAAKETTVVFANSNAENSASVTASFKVTYTGNASPAVTLILAAYDENGVMVDLNTLPINYAAATDTYTVTLTGLSKSYTYKAMAWDNMTNMTPLTLDETF